jgi:hypothetical protein
MKASWIQGCPASQSRVAQLLWPDRLPVITALSPAPGSAAQTTTAPTGVASTGTRSPFFCGDSGSLAGSPGPRTPVSQPATDQSAERLVGGAADHLGLRPNPFAS